MCGLFCLFLWGRREYRVGFDLVYCHVLAWDKDMSRLGWKLECFKRVGGENAFVLVVG